MPAIAQPHISPMGDVSPKMTTDVRLRHTCHVPHLRISDVPRFDSTSDRFHFDLLPPRWRVSFVQREAATSGRVVSSSCAAFALRAGPGPATGRGVGALYGGIGQDGVQHLRHQLRPLLHSCHRFSKKVHREPNQSLKCNLPVLDIEVMKLKNQVDKVCCLDFFPKESCFAANNSLY